MEEEEEEEAEEEKALSFPPKSFFVFSSFPFSASPLLLPFFVFVFSSFNVGISGTFCPLAIASFASLFHALSTSRSSFLRRFSMRCIRLAFFSRSNFSFVLNSFPRGCSRPPSRTAASISRSARSSTPTLSSIFTSPSPMGSLSIISQHSASCRHSMARVFANALKERVISTPMLACQRAYSSLVLSTIRSYVLRLISLLASASKHSGCIFATARPCVSMTSS
mmetsp:Transcript_6460/g.20268  ORF Transcript_6460/g.20268 Transcript_6460/m.20268 type:complete len:223 (+) Transcript_6460:2118-2786(+)